MARRPRTEQKERVPYHEQVANKLIEQLQAGTAPWQKPWEPGSLSLPHNPVSGTRYRGANSMWLQMQGRSDPRWMTYKQAAGIGAQVRKGEKGTVVQYWKFRDQIAIKDANGKPVKDAEGKQKYRTVELDKPRVFSAVVFSAEQIDGLPELKPVEVSWDSHERAENILAASGAKIRHDRADGAYYTVTRDEIHLPGRDSFKSADSYYATSLHELGHWTGHPSRLNRDLAHPFGSEGYAKEELRAEIASLMVGDQLGIGHDPGQHAAYVGSWVKVLKEDPKEILRAARDADKISDYVLAFEREKPAEKPADATTAKPTAPVIESPVVPTAGPQGPLDPAAIADRLTTPQATDLRRLADVHRETVGSDDWPEGRPEQLRTGKRLEALGLAKNARSDADASDQWRITDLGLSVADTLPSRETPEPPAATPPSGAAPRDTPDAALPAIPERVQQRLEALLQPSKEAQAVIIQNRTLGPRYVAEAWQHHQDQVASSYERMGTTLEGIPEPLNREAARRYLARELPDRYLEGQEREWWPERTRDIEAPAWARLAGPGKVAETVADPKPAKPSTDEKPPAFMLRNATSGLTELRDWNTGAPLPGDWTGIAQGDEDGRSGSGAAFWYVGRSGGERSWNKLKAEDYPSARAEAETLAQREREAPTAAPKPTAAAASPDTPASKLKAALENRDLKGALDTLKPLPLRTASRTATEAGLTVPVGMRTKADLYQALQTQLLKATSARPDAPAARPRPAPPTAGRER